jgi:murein L,D-transpeptidase YafK
MRRRGLFVVAGAAALMLAACTEYGNLPKEMRPLPADVKALLEKKGMEQKAPILVRIFKEESKLEVWKRQKSTARYALVKEYDICAWSGVLGPKIKEGDRQAPEGFYTIRPAQMNPKSSYHLAFNTGFPNEYDRAWGRTGSDLMVHGACSSRGCYSMTDENIQEIFTLGRLAFQGGQRDFQVQAFPFRMTPENMAKYRNNPNMPFWRMLKEGYDHFEVIRQPPKVDVCGKRYVFNATPENGETFNATAECPPMSVPPQVQIAVADKQAEDKARFIEIAAALDRKEEAAKQAMMLAETAEAEKARAAAAAAAAAPMSVATAPVSLEPATTASTTTAASAEAPAATGAAQAAPVPAEVASTSEAPVAPATMVAREPARVSSSLAYAPEEPEQSGGFFRRMIEKVNPF